MKILFNRRQFIARIAALVALPLAALQKAHAQITDAQTAALDAMIAQITRGAPLQRGRVKLEIPVLADNGNSVSLRVEIDSPMTPADHVKGIYLIAPRNPRPGVANFFFGPGAGRPQISTRIRLAGSQDVLAIAAMSDGSFWSASAEVAVTVSACWDAS